MQLPGRHEGRTPGEGRPGVRWELKVLGVGLLGLGAYGAYFVVRFAWAWTAPEVYGGVVRSWTDLLQYELIVAFGFFLAMMWIGWRLLRK